MKELTPVMKQYLSIKEKYKDALIFFRMGDFYEMFFDDAKLAARLLGITLTSREKDKDNGIPMCGVPHHSANGYIARLVKEGCKVAICEQVEDPKKAKGIVKREVTRVVTPGITLDEELLDSKNNNFIAAASCGSKNFGMAYMDVTTGEFRVTEFSDSRQLEEELLRIEPSEMILNNSISDKPVFKNLQQCKITYLPGYDFDYDTSVKHILKHFSVASLDGIGCTEMREGTRAAGTLLNYVGELQRTTLKHVRRLLPFYPHNYMVIDSTTKRNLEIFKTIRDGEKKGSLFGLLDRTKTAMGGRKLREWINYPLMDVDEIKKRYDSVEELLEDKYLRGNIQGGLIRVYDIERLIGRIALGVATPRDLVALKESLKEVPRIKGLLEKINSTLLKGIYLGLDEVDELTALIEKSIVDSPPLTIKEGGVIKRGCSKELDELRAISSGGKEWLSLLETKERERTGITSLKVSYNKVFGYYIVVTKANLSSVPSDYIRKQTLVNAERFITPELKEWEDKIFGAEEKATNLESALFQEIRETAGGYIERVQKTANLLAGLDTLSSLAQVADEMDYTRPAINEDDSILIVDGRHPVIEDTIDERFVPNDITLDCKDNQLIILTGPNMAGKSTYLRQTALIVLMSQTGSFVPAAKATIGVVDRIFTRVGASDDLARGQSTFMVEMGEAASILNNATPRSLIILDEVGRGTSTFDGLSIAWAIAEYIHDNPGLSAKTLFATHYHELTDLSLTKERVKNFSMAAKEWNEQIIFLRKVVPGGSNRSYGIQVARLAGLPKEVIGRAREILNNLEKGELNDHGMPKLAFNKGIDEKLGQLNLLGKKDILRDRLLQIDPNKMTPIDALQTMIELKEIAKDQDEDN
jgi:DNA mismatch repair protein MutS